MKQAVTRREFLVAGTAVAAGIAGIALACRSDATEPTNEVGTTLPEAPDDLVESPRLNAAAATLVAATDAITIAGRRALQPVTYNGLACGPTLVVRPGAMINLTLSNHIVETQGGMPLSSAMIAARQIAPHPVPGTRRTRRGHHGMAMNGMAADPDAGALTNMHFHGMHVPQSGNADNPFLLVASGSTQQYSFQVPVNHAAGLYWYHSHVVGLVTNQVGRGAAGLISIENAFTDRIAAMGIRRRLMQLHQLYFDADQTTVIPDDDNKDDTSDTVTLSLINGQLHPKIYMRPGEPQYWALANTSTTAWYLLSLAGHTFDVVAEDGTPLSAARIKQQQILIAPAKRLEVIVRATSTAGTYGLDLQMYDQGEDQWPAKPLATVVVAGDAWSGPDAPGVDTSHQLEDLRSITALPREIHFGEDPTVPEDDFGGFLINGRPFDPNRTDFAPSLDSVEEWTVINDSNEEHPFHMHTNQFQLTHVNGAPVVFDGYQDTTRIPRLGSITLRVRFGDFTGRTLTHCHIIDHECNGMMAIIDVERP